MLRRSPLSRDTTSAIARRRRPNRASLECFPNIARISSSGCCSNQRSAATPSPSDQAAIRDFFEATLKSYPAFFQAINEAAFIAGGFGGHAADSPKEFLASFLNGVVQEDWEQRVVLLPAEERRLYREALEAVAAAIRATAPEGAQLPILSRLEACQRFLDELL